MKFEDKLLDLLSRMGLDKTEVERRLTFLEWGQLDEQRLQQQQALAQPGLERFIEVFYQHLAEHPHPDGLAHDSHTVERLQRAQRDFFKRLWSGPYDRDYVLERLKVGWVHQHIGISTDWYLSAYHLYLSSQLQTLLGDHPQAELYISLLKAAFFDISLAIDIYNCAQAEALENSEARFARALRGANDGIWEWHLGSDHLYVSERWANMLGLTRNRIEPCSLSWFSRVHPEDLPGLRMAIDQVLSGHSSTLRHEYRIRHYDGQYIWVLARGIAEPSAKGEQRLTGSQSDISERRAAENELQHAARHDPLTGLANRARLNELLDQALERKQRIGARQVALLFIDLDRFKLINDSLGHAVGDQVLIEVSSRLRSALRPGDHLARFGGDEFVALLDDMAELTDAEVIAQRMLDALRQPLHLGEHTLAISASIGIAPLDPTTDNQDLLRAADLALYSAKQAGKAQFVRYNDQLHLHAQRSLALESALAHALHNREFSLHYQPICRINADGTPIIGVEALLRWTFAGQPISPQEFIPTLEETGEIVAVGAWVLEEACQQVRYWQLNGHPQLRCSVNLSIRQLQRTDLAQQVAQTLTRSGLAAHDLVLEITETQLMQDTAQTLATLRELASLGVRLALDDFGTGFSSLGYLKRFPLHILKLDKSFISGNPQDTDTLVISKAIIGLGKSLGLDVIAEGVECAEHLDFLREEGCAMAQGYWMSKPLPASALTQLLQHWETQQKATN